MIGQGGLLSLAVFAALISLGTCQGTFTFTATNSWKKPTFNITSVLNVTGEPFLNSMKTAADGDLRFQFSISYFAYEHGFLLTGINNCNSHYSTDNSYWEFFSGNVAPSAGVSDYIPRAGEALLMNFTQSPHSQGSFWQKWYNDQNESVL